MITKEIIELITKKLRSVIIYLFLIGILFFVLAAATLFYPQTLQFLFAFSFFAVSFLALLIALKISHIKKNFDEVLAVFSQKKMKRK